LFDIIKTIRNLLLKPQNIQGKGHIFTIANLHSNKRNSTTQETELLQTFNFTSLIWLALLSGVVPRQQLKSPNEAFTMDFSLQNDGTPTALKYKTKL
jgi:hypothetical protein